MRTPASAFFIPDSRLRLSPAPSAELAAAAMAARNDAGAGPTEPADVIVVVVEPGHGELVRAAVEEAARGAVAASADRPPLAASSRSSSAAEAARAAGR